MRRATRWGLAAAGVATLATAAGGAWLADETRNNRLVWDHWDVVRRGAVYRSGQLNPGQLAEAIRRYGLRTVVNFQIRDDRGFEAERAVCRRLGVDLLSLPMPGDGFGREDQFRAALAAAADPARRPVLFHCARGTCRTGTAVALYRFERNGWAIEDVQAELERQSYKDGWIAGYAFNMVRDRPFGSLFEPRMRLDRFAPPAPTVAEGPTDGR